MNKKKHIFEMQLNSINDTDSPTKKEVEFILHDFDVSHNYAFIKKETAEKVFETITNTPIVCQYHSVSQVGADDDALGSHGVIFDRDRSSGEDFITTDSIAIGVFTEPAFIKTIEVNGEDKEVVAAKGVLWASRFPNIISLIKQWYDEGVQVSSSMEILYDSYKVEDGITEILNFCYEGHCILNSESRGNHNKVLPAYDVSKLTRLVAEALNLNTKEENELKFKKVYELSHSDVRSLIYNKLDPTLEAESDSFISDVYDTYFIVNIYSWSDTNSFDKYYKIEYTKSENDVTINLDSKTEVFLTRNWEEVVPQEIQSQLSEKEEKIGELEKQVNSLTEEKESVEAKFNDSTEKLTQLNSLVEELKPIKEQFEAEKLEKAINEKKEFYSTKFEALNAKEQFDSEEVQGLILKSVNETDEGKQAILQLNSMLVDLVDVVVKQETTPIKEMASKRENLLPADTSFDSRYSL